MTSKNTYRVSYDYTQQLVAPAEEVFPLICPVREAEWLDGFEYAWVYSESGLAEMNAIFTTPPHGPMPASLWIITRHDPQEHVVDMVRVTGEWYVTHLRVAVEDAPGGGSAAHISYTFTALNEMGERAIKHHHSEPQFRQMVVHWERAVNHYLQTGETLPLASG